LSTYRVLLTGGCGFLGSHLANRFLDLGADVATVDTTDRPVIPARSAGGRYRNFVASVTDPDAMRRTLSSADIIVHLAAIADPCACRDNPERAWEVNVQGTKNVLDASPEGARFVFVSTAAVYGCAQYLPIDEGHPLLGSDPYARTKKAAEEACIEHASRLHMTIVRNFNTYGPGQASTYLIPQILCQGLRESRIEVWNREPVRDFSYVDDTVEALTRLTLLDGTAPLMLNLGSGEGHSVGEVVDIISRSLGRIPTTCLDKPVTGSPSLVANTKRARALLDWRGAVDLNEGIQRTLRWYRLRAT